jgi:hypothetical protein
MSLFSDDVIQPIYSESYIRDKYSDEQIYRKYHPAFELGTVHSPFRQENNPSFSFHDKSNQGHILWHDHKQKIKGDVFDFVMKWYLLHKQQKLSRAEVLARIDSDMAGEEQRGSHLRIVGDDLVVPKETKRKSRAIFTIEKPDHLYMPDFALKYWQKRSIHEGCLQMYDTGFADKVWITKEVEGKEKIILWGESTIYDPIFYWKFPSGNYKFYRPLTDNPKRKWISNISKTTDVQGYHQCDIKNRYPAILVLTKSMKDVMLLRMFGIDAMAVHGEGHDPGQAFIDHLRRYCSILISLYDNDWTGIRNGIFLRQQYGIPDFYYPKALGKDSDEVYMKDYHQFYHQLQIGLQAIDYFYDYNQRRTAMDLRDPGHLYPGERSARIRSVA